MRTAQTRVQQNAPQGGPADVDAFPFREQFAQMGVVGSLVSSAGQAHHVGDHRLGRGVDRFAAPVAVCQGGCSFLPEAVVMRRAWRVLTPINSAA